MNEIPIKQEDAIAFFRYQVISELLDAAPGQIDATAKRLSKQQFNDVVNKRIVTFSERTIYSYYSNYKKSGFDGLKPRRRTDKGKHPSIDTNLIQDILALKKELPTRSAAKILTMLVLTGRLEKDSISVRTINRILYQYGYTRESLSADNRYDEKYHTGIESTPIERWNTSLNTGAKLRYFSPVELEEIFLHSQERKINRYGVISFEGNTYEGPAELIGKTVIIRYSPFHLDCLHVHYNDKYFGVAKVIDLNEKKHKDVASVPEVSGYDSEISRLYFKNIKSNYQKHLTNQLSLSIDKDISGINEEEASSIEEHPIRPPKDPAYSISRDRFIDIVQSALSSDGLSYQEKGKLIELWDTFKEFNEEILVSILNDLSYRTKDFNRNFLYYIAQIRSNYLEQLNKLKGV